MSAFSTVAISPIKERSALSRPDSRRRCAGHRKGDVTAGFDAGFVLKDPGEAKTASPNINNLEVGH
jgi:hypothetical protein